MFETRSLLASVSGRMARVLRRQQRDHVARGYSIPSLIYRPNGKRERERRIRQFAGFNQLRSHKPGTVQPRHIFGSA